MLRGRGRCSAMPSFAMLTAVKRVRRQCHARRREVAPAGSPTAPSDILSADVSLDARLSHVCSSVRGVGVCGGRVCVG